MTPKRKKEKKMNRLHKLAAALLLSAALAVPAGAVSAFAEASETADIYDSKPVIVNYFVTDTRGKSLNALTTSTEFNMRIVIKDIGMKRANIDSAADIDFIKTLDSFKGTLKDIKLTESADGLLVYEVSLEKCKWTGGEKTFGFMVGYPALGAEYRELSMSVGECVSAGSGGGSDVAETVAEPMFRITADEPSSPINAGDEGTLTIKIKNLGTATAERVLVDFSCDGDLLFTSGTASQEVNFIVSGDTETMTLRYKAPAKLTSTRQNISVTLRYFYDNGSSMVQGSANSSFSLASEVSSEQRVYPVVVTDFTLSEKQLEPNAEYTGVVTVKNIGTADMNGVSVRFTGTDSFIVTDGTSSAYIDSIKQGGSAQFTVNLRTLGEISALRQELGMTLKYSYTTGGEEQNDSYEGSFTMFAPISGSEPLPYVTFSKVDEPVSAGHKYRYYVYIENKGDTAMEDVRVAIKGGECINIIDGTDAAYIESVGAGEKKSVKVMFETAAEITSASQQIGVSLSYSYTAAGKKNTAAQDAAINIPSEISGAPVLRMSGEKLAKALLPDTEYEYTLTLTNYGEIAVKELFIDFTGSDSIYFLDGTEYTKVDLIRAGNSADIKVKFRTTANISSVKQSISASIRYSYGVSSAMKDGAADCSVTLIAAAAEAGGSTDGAPNVILSGYDIGAEQIAAGDTFTLALDFYNTSATAAVENLIMTVNASGDIGIYGGGNTYFYNSLSAAGAMHEDVKLRALATAATGTSSVNISFKYDYVDNGVRNTVTTDQTLYIPVYQPDKMTFDVAVPNYSVTAGDEVYITTTYMNKGRSDISNCKAEIVGDVGALSTSKVLGNLAPGANGSFDFIVTPYMSGQCEFTIKITYEDATLTEVVREYPVSFPVEEMFFPDYGTSDWVPSEEMPAEEGGFPWLFVWIGAGVVAAAGIVVLIIVLVKRSGKKRKKLTEEDINWEDDLDDVLSESSDSDKKNKV